MSSVSSRRQQAEELGASEQLQEALKLASMGGGGVEVEGKPASIKSISDSIQSSMACCLSSSSICLSSSFSRLSLSGSRRQLSIDKNERKRERDEPDAPLLLERELTVGEGDVVIGREERNQANNTANDGFQDSFAVKPKPPLGQRCIQIPRIPIHPKQPTPISTSTRLVHAYAHV